MICLLVCLASDAQSQKPSVAAKPSADKPAAADAKSYVTAVAKTGDDVAALLTRYGLFDFECNVAKFLKLNNLKTGSVIKAAATYKLPVEVVAYNGKSIRTTLDISDWRVAKRIELFNHSALEAGLRTDNFIQTKRLWVPWHELNCPPSIETASITPLAKERVVASANTGEKSVGGNSRNFAIFGKKHQHTPLISNKLKGKVFYIVSGHGGPDSGAQGQRAGHTLCEDEYAYDVSLRLLKLLLSHNATAYMIVRDPNDGIRDEEYLNCDKDEVVWGDKPIPLDQKERLQQRCDIINEFTKQHTKAGIKDQTLIEIHVDSRSHDHKTDVFFYYRPGSEPSHKLALHIQQVFLTKYLKKRNQRGYTGTVTPRNLYMLKETITPKTVYIELANIRNSWDQQRLVLKNNRQALANWICEALLTH
ncbi:MAG: N-acetylmuramoyl-L-alanine amidase [Saprospiraceae bacterium]|nr:N-acetylmuramoyl-L-alanine amidase [Saprospiraceae bacterium]